MGKDGRARMHGGRRRGASSTAIAALAVLGLLLAACGSSAGKTGGSGTAATSAPPAGSSSSSSGASGVTLDAVVTKKAGAVTSFVPVTIHGKKFYFDFDSGAVTTILDTAVAKELKLASAGKAPSLKTVGCTSKPTLSRVDNWSVGSLKLKTAKIVTQDTGFSKMKVKGAPVAGFLGADIQSSAGAVSVDYQNQKVVLGAKAPSGGKKIDVKIAKEGALGVALVAPVTIAGKQVFMIVDTGASKTTITTSVAKQLKLPTAGKAVKVNAIGCPATVTPITLSGAKIGDVAVPKTVVASTPKSVAGNQIAGLFGADLLASYGKVTLDYKNSTVTLGG